MATPKKKPATKKTTAKKATRSTAATTSRAKKPAQSTQNAMSALYWTLLGVAVIALAAWVLWMQLNVTDTYNSVEETDNSSQTVPKANGY